MIEICNNPDSLIVVRIIKILIDIIKILVPIILIIKTTIDISKITFNSKPEVNNTTNIIVKRLIAALAIFLIPTIIPSIIDMLSNEKHDYYSCIENATLDKINALYVKIAEEKIADAKEDLSYPAYSIAQGAVEKVDNEERKRLDNEIKKLRDYLDVKGLINTKLSGSAQDIKEIINKIDDQTVRNTLNNEVNAQNDLNESSSFSSEPKEAITPNANDTIIKKEERDTLKVYIIKRNSYYITKIWAKEPYVQLNKYDSPEYGRNLYKPSELLNRAIRDNNLANKLIVGFNASGFYKKNVYDADSVKKYPAYDLTSVGSLVITSSRVVRNAYNKSYKTWFVAGIKPNNELQIFTDIKSNDENAKKNWSNAVINSGIRNTFTFASILVSNGQASDITTSMPSPSESLNRQAFCQIDNNNFVLITGSNLNRKKLIEIMLEQKCLTGTNFDGGGSIALVYKSSTSTNIETIIGNGRALSEVGYFTE